MKEKELERLTNLKEIEKDLHQKGFKNICGIDEAGRGPLAGPVVIASVIMPEDSMIEGVNDSKKISEKKREALYDKIVEEAISYSVSIIDHNVIDEINILNATKQGVTNCIKSMDVRPDLIIVDALEHINTDGVPYESLIKGDARCYSIAAASIIAKVTRDRIMREWDEVYPEYGFISHKGYGTAKHIAAIKEFGLCPIHRKSFTKNFVKQEDFNKKVDKTTTKDENKKNIEKNKITKIKEETKVEKQTKEIDKIDKAKTVKKPAKIEYKAIKISRKKKENMNQSNINILDIISKKRDKKELTKEEIEYFVEGYVKETIKDYQAAALVMAIFLNGMTKKETTYLTMAMANSGEILDLSEIGKIIVDKHSTGGVGDKVSICLLPLVASLGVPVAKMSGRGLGFTGGTVDKMESIPGYKTAIETKEFIKNVKNVGISMISQTLNLAPADKKLYALRDSISCVEKISLIASSIMSKKIASGANKIVIDVTVGKGAFMKNMTDAKKLANEMIDIGNLANRETICVLTDMDEPLGYAVGNNLEIIEAINFLKGNMPEDLKQVVLELGSYMIKLAGLGEDLEENKLKMLENIKNGKALNKFEEMVKTQNGDISYIENTEKFEKAKYIEPVICEKDGFIHEINAEQVGKLACYLGAGRIAKEDNIDYSVGIIFNKKVADRVNKGDILAYIHSNNQEKLETTINKLKDVIKIDNNHIERNPTILDICK